MAKKSAVQVLWDRKKVADKKGYGHIEIIIYFTKKERKHISFGKCTPMEWRRLENSKEIR